MSTNQRYVQTGTDIVAQRSRMPLNRRTLLSYFHGYLQPVGTPIEVLPGDTFKAVISAFTRMSTPILPIMDDIRQEIDAFFVPKRILWNKTKQFYGEAESFGVATKVLEPYNDDYNFGRLVANKSELTTNLQKSETFSASFGLVADSNVSAGNMPKINFLPIRAYLAVYNEYFRDENYQDQFTWNKDAAGNSQKICATLAGSSVSWFTLLPQVNKDRDVVSSLLPYQIKGNPVMLSIGDSAPVQIDGKDLKLALVGSSDNTGTYFTGGGFFTGSTPFDETSGNLGLFWYGNGDSLSPRVVDSGDHPVHFGVSGGKDNGNISQPADMDTYPLTADLSSAAAVSISNLIYSLAYQDFLARSAHFGTRYKEYIYGMFGTKIADASEDIPEYLGRLKFRININQVVQTTGFDASSSTELGALGAYSNSGNTGKLFTKSFAEPGYVVIVSYTKHQRTYSTGIDRVFLKNELLDYYQPPFANIADVPYGSHNIWLDGSAETSLGFQEPWYDYRGLMDRCYGMMNPKLDTLGQLWTLADNYASKPTIGAAFMKEDRDAISRVLSTGVNGPDYIMDFQLNIDATRVMPLFASGRLRVM